MCTMMGNMNDYNLVFSIGWKCLKYFVTTNTQGWVLPYMMGFIVLLQSFMSLKEQIENLAIVCLALPKAVGVTPVDKKP